MSTTKDHPVSSITPLNSHNYRLWADDIKSWLQLHGLWRLVVGLEKKPTAKAEDKLEKWEVKAERAAGALKSAMSHDVKVLIRDFEDDP
ncbi:hypothetical protein BC834DRAFT_837270, partial [Gloeopeniophorella convolvens]